MDLSAFTYILGILEILIGLPLLFYPKATRTWMTETLKQDALMQTIGAVFVILATLTLGKLSAAGIRFEGLNGFLTFITWLVALKGLLLTFWPHLASDLTQWWFRRSANCLALTGLLKIAFGIFLLYAGWVL